MKSPSQQFRVLHWHRRHCEGLFNIKGEYEKSIISSGRFNELQLSSWSLAACVCLPLTIVILHYVSKIPIHELLNKNNKSKKDE